MHNTRLIFKWQFIVIENFLTKLFIWIWFIIITSIISPRISIFRRFPFPGKIKINIAFDWHNELWLYDDWSFWWFYWLWTSSRFWCSKNTYNTTWEQTFFCQNMHLWLRKRWNKMMHYPCIWIIFQMQKMGCFFKDDEKSVLTLESVYLYLSQPFYSIYKWKKAHSQRPFNVCTEVAQSNFKS